VLQATADVEIAPSRFVRSRFESTRPDSPDRGPDAGVRRRPGQPSRARVVPLSEVFDTDLDLLFREQVTGLGELQPGSAGCCVLSIAGRRMDGNSRINSEGATGGGNGIVRLDSKPKCYSRRDYKTDEECG
jgi:hypothetical protein